MSPIRCLTSAKTGICHLRPMHTCTALKSQKAVTAYLKSEQLLPFAWQASDHLKSQKAQH